MASFCTTFHSIRKNDLKHMYYGHPVTAQYREAGSRGLQPVLKQAEVERRDRPLPAAPAFRALPRRHVDGITDRVWSHRKGTATDGSPTAPRDVSPRAPGTGHTGPGDAEGDAGLRFQGTRRMGAADQAGATRRLCALTHVARLRAERDPYRQIVINAAVRSHSFLIKRIREDPSSTGHQC